MDIEQVLSRQGGAVDSKSAKHGDRPQNVNLCVLLSVGEDTIRTADAQHACEKKALIEQMEHERASFYLLKGLNDG